MLLEAPAKQLLSPETLPPASCLFMEIMGSEMMMKNKKFKKKCCKKYKKGKRCKRCPGRMS